MASRFDPEPPPRLECENCGSTSGLLRCSRCHAAWFCSLKCHKVYWPFHREGCRPNQFADAVEPSEPRFAAWMRGHGRLAVLQDDEVDRLERASKPGGCWGLSRDEVMDSMYGRLDPRPRAPTYDERERAAMAEARRGALAVRQTALALRSGAAAAAAAQDALFALPGAGRDEGAPAGGGVAGAAWESIAIREGFGLAVSSRLKWRQTQKLVEVYVRLPEALALQLTAGRSIKSKVCVEVRTDALRVAFAGDEVLSGPLHARVKAEAATWYIDDGMVQITLLKSCRRGRYAAGATNADTWWPCLLAGSAAAERLPGPHPPAAYYSSPYEEPGE